MAKRRFDTVRIRLRQNLRSGILSQVKDEGEILVA